MLLNTTGSSTQNKVSLQPHQGISRQRRPQFGATALTDFIQKAAAFHDGENTHTF
jgi:hypothetical protein